MNALLNHSWGLSHGADRVWAQVVGMRPSQAVERRLMVLQAFIDDSYESDGDGFYVLGGVLSSAEKWAKFSAEWEELLPSFGVLDKDGKYHFKMSEMALNDERLARVPAFYRVIENNAVMFLSARIRQRDFHSAIERVYIQGRPINIKNYKNIYIFVFKALMTSFHTYVSDKAEIISGNQVDFIFDDQTEKRMVLEGWDTHLNNVPEHLRKRYGATPRFEDDKVFLPLQAGDLWAWWVRKWSSVGQDHRITSGDFGWFKSKMPCAVMDVSYSEDDIMGSLAEMLVAITPPGYAIWDRKTGKDMRLVVARHFSDLNNS